jgi:hypothetical protein
VDGPTVRIKGIKKGKYPKSDLLELLLQNLT